MGDFLSIMRKRQLEDESLEDLLGTAQKQASGEIPYKPAKYDRNTSTQQKLADIDSRIANYTYKQYVDSDDYASLLKRYSKQGLKAMDDTIGKVAARTGGIASSYAASAGAQANNAYLTEFENIAREMYDKNLSDMKDERAYLYARDKEQRDNARELALMQMQHDRSDEATRYSRLVGAAETLAKYGDFSGYAELGYTPEQIAKMESAYKGAQEAAASEADMEWALKYHEATGEWPEGWKVPTGGEEDLEPETEPEKVSEYYRGELPEATKAAIEEYGAFENGYQPKGITGYGKLKDTGKQIYVTTYDLNGQKVVKSQKIWKTDNNEQWVWDGSKMEYVALEAGKPVVFDSNNINDPNKSVNIPTSTTATLRDYKSTAEEIYNRDGIEKVWEVFAEKTDELTNEEWEELMSFIDSLQDRYY